MKLTASQSILAARLRLVFKADTFIGMLNDSSRASLADGLASCINVDSIVAWGSRSQQEIYSHIKFNIDPLWEYFPISAMLSPTFRTHMVGVTVVESFALVEEIHSNAMLDLIHTD